MKRFIALVVVSLVALLTVAPPARGATRGVVDNANFFTPQAEQQATEVIEAIAKKHHGQDVLIETQNDTGGQSIDQFVADRAKSSRVNGVYVLIVRKGGITRVLADRETAQLFAADVRTELAQQIDRDIRAAKAPPFDTALLNAVSSVSNTYNRGERQASPAPRTQTGTGVPTGAPRTSRPGGNCGFGGIGSWICLIAGVWIIFSLVRGMMNRNRYAGGGPGAPGYGGGMGGGPGYGGGGFGGGGFGGGGWGTSILGGLFGAAAGNWMYDHFFRSGTAHGQTPPADYGGGAAPSDPNWAGGGDMSQGYEQSGSGGMGDYGGGGGGADYGGGGGDYGGGGDFGGGGGDAGGGGDYA